MNGIQTFFVLLVCVFLRSTIAISVRDEFDSVTKRMDQMEQENLRMFNRMTQMEQENEQMKSQIHELEEENKEQRDLDRKLVTENKELWDVIEKQENVLPNLLSNCTIPETLGNKRRRSFPQVPYAFSAVLDHEVLHVSKEQTIIFNHIILNDGNAYNNNTGVFTVPIGGVYLFYLAFATGYEPHKIWLHIVVDGVPKVAGVAVNIQQSLDVQGTNLVLLRLRQGESVWVSSYKFSDVTIFGSKLFTTFSGTLLYH